MQQIRLSQHSCSDARRANLGIAEKDIGVIAAELQGLVVSAQMQYMFLADALSADFN